MSRNLRYIAPVLFLPLLTAVEACPDAPPDQLVTAMRMALTAEALGFPLTSCESFTTGTWSPTSTAQQVVDATLRITAGACPTWEAEAITIPAVDRPIVRGRNIDVQILGFGQTHIATNNVAGEVRLKDPGWFATHNHPNHLAGGIQECPEKWSYRTYRVVPKVVATSGDSVEMSYIVGGVPLAVTAEVTDSFVWEPAVFQEWCEPKVHDGVTGLYDAQGRYTTTVHDPEELECPSDRTSRVTPCTQHSDCSGLPCGEWVCDAATRSCVAAAVFPDGTPCSGGSCQAGECLGP